MPRKLAPPTYCPEMAALGLCSANACGAKVKARGLCEKHYLWGIRRGLVPPKKDRKLRLIVPHPFDPSLALVPLTLGHFATISVVDAPEIGKSNWWATTPSPSGIIYARGWRADRAGVVRRISLHRFIGDLMGLKLEIEVDHRNGNGLDCRRFNLRDANEEENAHNARMRRDNTSGVKGVSWEPGRELWMAQLWRNGKAAFVGGFKTIEEATEAVRVAREILHGEFANHGDN